MKEFKPERIGEIIRQHLKDIIGCMKTSDYDNVRDRLWKMGRFHSKLLFYIFKDVKKDKINIYDFKKSIFDYTNKEIDKYLILNHVWDLLKRK